MTACKDCEHLRINDNTDGIVGHEEGDPPIWHQLHCIASPEPLEFDPLSGLMLSFQGHGRYEGYKHIREVNMGHCDKYREK